MPKFRDPIDGTEVEAVQWNGIGSAPLWASAVETIHDFVMQSQNGERVGTFDDWFVRRDDGGVWMVAAGAFRFEPLP